MPPVTQGHHIPVNPNTISSPSFTNVGYNLLFMALLNLHELDRLTNDPIFHQSHWPPMPTKIPSNIPKFEGKEGEFPQNHIMKFHLWCSSNNIVDDLIRLRLFQRTLSGARAKWYIELPQSKYPNFNSLASCSCSIFKSPSNTT